MARSWRGAALGLALGVAILGCRFEPTGQPSDDIGPDPAVDAAQPLDARRPLDAGSARPPDAASTPGDAGGAQRPTLPAWAVEDDDIDIDGDLGEWSDDDWLEIAAPGDYLKNNDPSEASAADISMRFAARWHPDAGLYLAFEVTDEFHSVAPGNNDVLWRGDSVQAAFDVGLNGGAPYDGIDDFEYGWALAGNNQERAHRWAQGNGAPGPQTEFRIVRDGVTTTYEVRMPPLDLALGELETGQRIGFSVAVNDDDDDIDPIDQSRDGWIEWTPGIAAGPKVPDMFGVLELRGDPD